MKKNYAFLGLLLLLFAGALAIRLPRLDLRPMHADEAVQASRFRQLHWGAGYRYDPHEYHGPTLNYLTLPMAWLTQPAGFADTTETTYRTVPVLYGAGLILLLLLLHDALGRMAALWAGALVALSPAMVFYNRYYIHESLLVFFTLLAIACAWRYARSGHGAWCVAAGMAIGSMQATKETAPLALASMALAVAACLLWHRFRPQPDPDFAVRVRARHLVWGAAAAVVVAAVWFSSFLTNPQGPVDGVLTYLPWLGRAAGESPHIHPWHYYLRLLSYWRVEDGPVWSEGAILALALVGWLIALSPVGLRLAADGNLAFVRWMGFYTVSLAAVYSAIPYKTPWCLLGFLHGATLLAGFGAAALVRLVAGRLARAMLVAGLAAACAHLGWQAYRASFVMPADAQNPYTYVQSLPDITRLAHDVEEIASAAPGDSLTVRVFWHDGYYWPLPWYLRRFDRVEYWTKVPADAAAPLVISSPWHDEALTRQLDDTHLMTGYYLLRKNVFAQLWVRMDVWEAHLRRIGAL